MYVVGNGVHLVQVYTMCMMGTVIKRILYNVTGTYIQIQCMLCIHLHWCTNSVYVYTVYMMGTVGTL